MTLQSATWVQWLGTVLVAAATGLAGLRLVVSGRSPAPTHRASDVTLLLMGAGMAAMLAPPGDPVPAAGWEVLFAGVVGWCVVAALRERVLSHRLMWVRHAAMGLAIIYLFAALPMTMSMPGTAALTWVLVAYFAACATWSALTAAGVELGGSAEVATAAGGPRLPATWMLAPRTASLCEGVMATSMAWMLLAMR
jgi:uncharacterized protein DUF5134